ncbi:MAG: SPOR domain-containing protein [Gemmatimonadota bacterium]
MARLRLGQLRLAGGREDRALRDLERLRADFPGHPLVTESWFWTGLARRAAGRPDEACEALLRAARDAEASDRDGLAVRARDEARVCGEDEAASSDEAAASSWTVQIGAFSTRDGAEGQVDRLDREGHDGRLVTGDDGLVRVRVGRFAREADAERLADRLEASGFDAVVVSADGSSSGP